jgi:hypothetical protein
MLLGMFLMFLMMSAAGAAVLWLVWCRLGDHLKQNDEAVSALTRHLLIPLLGKKEKPEGQVDNDPPDA